MDTLDILNEIRSTPKQNEKKAILTREKDNHELKSLLMLTYSPLIRFGISFAKLPKVTHVDKDLCIGLTEAIARLTPMSEGNGLSGDKGKETIAELLMKTSKEIGEVIAMVIDSSLKLGCNVSTINKAMKSKEFSIPDVPYMGAVSFSEKKVNDLFASEPVLYSQEKIDGRFTNVTIQNGSVTLESRQGLPTYFGSAMDDLAFFEVLFGSPIVINGEMGVKGVSDRYTANGIISSVVSIGEKIINGENTDKEMAKFHTANGMSYEDMLKKITLIVWDFIPLESYLSDGKWDKPYSQRLAMLNDMVDSTDIGGKVTVVETKEVTTKEEANRHFKEIIARGGEGTILKSTLKPFKKGKPTYQIKYKLAIELDLEVLSGNWGTANSKNAGVISSINVATSCGLLSASPGGMSESMMAMVTENIDTLKGTIVKVKCNGLSQDRAGKWSLLHPAVIEFRTDKVKADDLHTCQSIENASKAM